MIAYLFATCIPGQERDVISKIKRLPGVIEVNGIKGRYDIFVKISAKNDTDLHTALTGVRFTPSVTSTVTFTAIRNQGGTIDQEEE